MARLARVVVPGMPHQITQRGNRRQTTFFCDEDYSTYLDLMSQFCGKHGMNSGDAVSDSCSFALASCSSRPLLSLPPIPNPCFIRVSSVAPFPLPLLPFPRPAIPPLRLRVSARPPAPRHTDTPLLTIAAWVYPSLSALLPPPRPGGHRFSNDHPAPVSSRVSPAATPRSWGGQKYTVQMS